MDARLFLDIATILVVALVGGLLAHWLRQPVILGYLLAGVALGPHTPGITVRPQSVQTVAELGVALLMFAVGVEFSLRGLARVRHVAVWGGLIQIALTVALGYALGRYVLDWNWFPSVFLGAILAMSSTMIVMKLLGERGDLQSHHGLAMLALLIAQDLAVVVLVAVLPPLADLERVSVRALGISLLTVVGYLVLASILAFRTVPWLLHAVAGTRSRELLVLTAAGICFAAAVGTHYLGFSVALGAFIAGLIISESEYSHEVLAEVIPLRDLFASLFFVSIGMMFDPAFLLSAWEPVLMITAAILLGKALIVGGVVAAFGFHPRAALFAGLGLAQIGEFSFVMAKLGLERGLVQEHFYDLVLSAALLTIFVTPFLYDLAPRLAPGLARLFPSAAAPTGLTEEDAARLRDHVVVCGCGRVGAQVGAALTQMGVPFAVVDYDRNVVLDLAARGVPAIYGDSSRAEVLARVRPDRARTGVVTIPDLFAARLTVRRLRAANPRLPIVARAHALRELDLLRADGADEVVLAEHEAGLEVLRYALLHHGIPPAQAQAYVDGVRGARYQLRPESGPGERPIVAAESGTPDEAERHPRAG